ncbi:hypothetical protein Z962_p0083 (plasmid) [Clostridium botulinum C/D str. BKT12695]|nr:hypothetical protein Z962_p0083 [Clostridium botulinum C/D str. BKT12695]
MFKFFKKFTNPDKTNALDKGEQNVFSTNDIPENFELKYEFKNAKVYGVQYCNPDKNKLEHDFVNLIFEKNKFDSMAVKVTQNSIKLGYLSRYDRPRLLTYTFYKEHGLVLAKLKRINKKTISIDMFFYDDKNKIYNDIETKLIKASTKDRQSALEFISSGDRLNVQYNFDTETYEVFSDTGESLGELNKGLSKKLYSLNISDDNIYCDIAYKHSDLKDIDDPDSKIYGADLIVSYISKTNTLD